VVEAGNAATNVACIRRRTFGLDGEVPGDVDALAGRDVLEGDPGRADRVVLLVAFGVMNVWAMLALVAIVVGEKVLRRGETIGRYAGGAFLVLSVLVLVSPSVANPVVPSPGAGSMERTMEMRG
jgi:hypothetical protein